jgi:GNAT superfamily N-acetyltransferase
MPFVVDRLGARDLVAALRLSTQAGWNQTAMDWQRLFDLSPEGCLAGRLDGSLVATATVASFGRSAHWIGMVLVDETLRGKGLGSTMLSHAIEFAKSRGEGIIGLDATDLGRPVYLKQGFADVAPIDRWSGVLRGTQDIRDVGTIDRSSFDEIARLDRASCGVDRSDFILHLMNEPDVLGVVSNGKDSSGFAFLRPGRTCGHVGPIVAKDGADCLRLLTRLAQLAGGSPVLVDAIRTPVSSALLEQSGLRVVRRLTRMGFGNSNPVLMGQGVRAAVSFEWG